MHFLIPYDCLYNIYSQMYEKSSYFEHYLFLK